MPQDLALKKKSMQVFLVKIETCILNEVIFSLTLIDDVLFFMQWNPYIRVKCSMDIVGILKKYAVLALL